MSPSLIDTPPYTYVFYAVFLGWVLLNARLLGRERTGAVRRERRHSKLVLGTLTSAGIVAAVAFHYVAPWAAMRAPRPAFWFGIVFLIAGGVLRECAVQKLGRYFTVDLGVEDDQSVIEDGPYHWVRHPSYLGSTLSYLGIGVVFANWLSLAVVAVSLAVGYWYRITVEEELLRAELGDAYEEYAERTPYRLVPGLW
ncbi:methyltransferase family protein [Halorientalis brevis]|uniref:Methyltransferase family protein n=1 Tax=Halorientalis brevis TaxID=1126241 RepID=A0ABD6C8D5_9EURY|nr:isoprenylcysteine carboxylmethyltransferase family protein [Halorientalis brevis]